MDFEEVFEKLADREIKILFSKITEYFDWIVKPLIQDTHNNLIPSSQVPYPATIPLTQNSNVTYPTHNHPNYQLQHQSSYPTHNAIPEKSSLEIENYYIQRAIAKQDNIGSVKPTSNLDKYLAERDAEFVYVSEETSEKRKILKLSTIFTVQRTTFESALRSNTNALQNSTTPKLLAEGMTNADILNIMKTRCEVGLINEEYSLWLTNSPLADEWLKWLIKNNKYYSALRASSVPISSDSALDIIDKSNTAIEVKKQLVDQARQAFESTKLKGRDLNWLDEESDKQVDWGINYLSQKDLLLALNKNITLDEKYRAIVNTIGITYYQSPDRGELLLRKLKQTWAAKKHRDSGNAKKNLYFPMSMNTEKNLNKLAKHYGLKPHQYLEKIINEAIEREKS